MGERGPRVSPVGHDDDLEALWAALHAARPLGGSELVDARNAVVVRHAWLADAIARRYRARFAGRHELVDLQSEAHVALIQAVESYDRRHGVPFTVWASQRIRGQMLDYARRQDTVSRRSRQLARRADCAEHPGADAEHVAAGSRVGASRVVAALVEVERANLVAFDVELVADVGGGPATVWTSDPAAVVETRELEHAVRAAVDRLPVRHARLIRLVFDEGLTKTAVAEREGVHKTRVGQLIAEALAMLESDLRRLDVVDVRW